VTLSTHVQCHFVRGLINHRLRFGRPAETIRLDKYRKIAVFAPGQCFGYIRWIANEYGTQDWRLYIVEAGSSGLATQVPGISPAVRLCIFINGPKGMRQALSALDRIENQRRDGLENLPVSYWMTFKSRLNPKNNSSLLPQKFVKNGGVVAY